MREPNEHYSENIGAHPGNSPLAAGQVAPPSASVKFARIDLCGRIARFQAWFFATIDDAPKVRKITQACIAAVILSLILSLLTPIKAVLPITWLGCIVYAVMNTRTFYSKSPDELRWAGTAVGVAMFLSLFSGPIEAASVCAIGAYYAGLRVARRLSHTH